MVLIHWCRRRLLLYLQLLSVPELFSAPPKSAPLKKGNLGRCRLCLSALLVASERFILLADPCLLVLLPRPVPPPSGPKPGTKTPVPCPSSH